MLLSPDWPKADMRTVSLVALNPATARRHGIDPRVIDVQFGWWFPERKDAGHGVWQSNANVLASMDPPYDPVMETYQLRALLWRIAKAGAA